MKTSLKILLALVLVIGVVIGVGVGHLGRVVKSGVEETGPEVTGTPVALDDATISVFSGAGALKKLTVSNPEGFSEPYAFDVNEVDLQVQLPSVLDEVVVVDKLHIDGARLVAELSKDGRNNLKIIRDHARSRAAETRAGPAAESSRGASDRPTRFAIRSFKFTNAELKAVAPALDVNKTLSVPNIELRDLGTVDDPLNSAQLVNRMLQPVIGQALKQVRDDFTSSQIDKIKNKIGDALDDMFD